MLNRSLEASIKFLLACFSKDLKAVSIRKKSLSSCPGVRTLSLKSNKIVILKYEL